jgi:hypothetical protein
MLVISLPHAASGAGPTARGGGGVHDLGKVLLRQLAG